MRPVELKLECLQYSGSFKARGAMNTALATGADPLVAASGGNHGLAVAEVARRLDRAAEIFVPEVTPEAKRRRIREAGATLHVTGALYADAQAACDAWARSRGLPVVHPYDTPHTVAGQATLGVELSEQIPDLDAVVVAVGGGGLAAGLAAALPRRVRLVAVEPRTSACFHAAVAAGGPVDVEVSGVAADSLGARRVGGLAWALLGERAESVLVDDETIEAGRRRLWDEVRLLVEPGGAAAFAAVAAGAVDLSDAGRVAVIVCGANTDPGW
ncbi:MAG: pyridoxal-phosphate dependent enzyme [Actinomyces sp.]|nr:MAG: pyridoxal-phosphate dependent enzyme [Actinomyces sp.]